MPEIKLIEEHYERSTLKRDTTESATVPLAAAAIDRLDGRRRSLLSLVDDSARKVLMIGGGADGEFVAQLIVDSDRAFFRLARKIEPSDEKKKLVVGGQSGWYRLENCLSRQDVQHVIEVFIDGHELPRGLNWEN